MHDQLFEAHQMQQQLHKPPSLVALPHLGGARFAPLWRFRRCCCLLFLDDVIVIVVLLLVVISGSVCHIAECLCLCSNPERWRSECYPYYLVSPSLSLLLSRSRSLSLYFLLICEFISWLRGICLALEQINFSKGGGGWGSCFKYLQRIHSTH